MGRGLFVAKSLTDNKSLNWPQEMLSYGAEVLSDDTLDDFFASLPVRVPPLEMDAVPF